MSESRKGRPRKGTLEWSKTKNTWQARVTVVEDGETIRKRFPLGTQSRPVARRKLAKLLDQLTAGEAPTAEQASAEETFQEAAERIVKQAGKDGLKTWRERLSR